MFQDLAESFPCSQQDGSAIDLISKVRGLVVACRASGGRHEDLHAVIVAGNEAKFWDLNPCELPCDVDTHWSSVFLMIDRVLELNQVGIF